VALKIRKKYMKITKKYLRQVIQEERRALEEYGSNWEAGDTGKDSIAPGDPAKAKVLAIAELLQGVENNKSFGFDPKVSQKIITNIRDILDDTTREIAWTDLIGCVDAHGRPAPCKPPRRKENE
jgi:hypothetical protein